MSATITVYEEYETAAEKRRAQVGAKRMKPTGKARGYFFAYTCNGTHVNNGVALIEGVSSVFPLKPGEGPGSGLAGTSASLDYLREKCRRVGACHLPPAWKKKYDYYRKDDE